MGADLQSSKKCKIHFIMQKQVDFGKAIYVIGNIPQLGLWDIKNSLKLSWFKDHYWTGFVNLSNSQLGHPIQYKYVIANWDLPEQSYAEWEAGSRNRIIDSNYDSQHVICQNTWNMEKITLNLIVPDDGKNQQYSVIGDCKELGNWKKSFKLKKNQRKNLNKIPNLKLQNGKTKYAVYSFNFQIFRGKSRIHYYYIKKNINPQIQRNPGRKYLIGENSNTHPKCLRISHSKGDTQMFQICNFKQLNYSKITDNILVGPYLKTLQDFQLLKQQGVSSILSIQTPQDLALHDLTQDYLQKQSVSHNINFFNYEIQDMNKKDFLQKCLGAIELLKDLVQKYKKVYVHCSAGVYRSPQIVALFLILKQKYSPKQALQYVKSRHPFARPNSRVVHNAVQLYNKKKQLKSQESQF